MIYCLFSQSFPIDAKPGQVYLSENIVSHMMKHVPGYQFPSEPHIKIIGKDELDKTDVARLIDATDPNAPSFVREFEYCNTFVHENMEQDFTFPSEAFTCFLNFYSFQFVAYIATNAEETLDEEFCFVSSLVEIMEFGKSLGLKAIPDYKYETPSDTQRKQKALEIVSFIISILSGLIASFFPQFIPSSKLSRIVIAIFIPIVGMLLYYLRCNNRLFYGLVELVVGITTGIRAVFPIIDNFSVDVGVTLQILGGLYIIVRGLDNIEKGLEQKPFGTTWKKLFYRQKKKRRIRVNLRELSISISYNDDVQK